ncbi:YpjP family protein [Halobacillus campisalis]|uniref:YpjP family protein n=1 Tax=Halobacillus campisalis TaxID=435909 RepID=A0ABW2K9Z5_9BACI|nr:YpjP family protein [Halobacillus campisalis]
MNLWIRKVFVVLITIMTLGIYIPPAYAEMETAENKEVASKDHADHVDLENDDAHKTDVVDEEVSPFEEPVFSTEYYVHTITEQAKGQMVTKMGPKIIDKVEADFERDILPKVEEVIADIISEAGEEDVPYYEVTEELTPGYGEKIFTVLDGRTKEEIARFDVRRDIRPGEGYWFNFHYHLNEDSFEEHHSIGEIYWDKNTPPKWMS